MNKKKTQFFTFRQNNSGGSFTYDLEAGLGVYVIIEAHDSAEANDKAEAIGIYFNGCSEGMDCNCCGDRWNAAWEDGNLVPQVYSNVNIIPMTKAELKLLKTDNDCREAIFIHYLNKKKFVICKEVHENH